MKGPKVLRRRKLKPGEYPFSVTVEANDAATFLRILNNVNCDLQKWRDQLLSMEAEGKGLWKMQVRHPEEGSGGE